jgi:DNA-binding NtrC family response regulator
VRQLENVIKRLILLSTQKMVSQDDVTSVLEFEAVGMAAKKTGTGNVEPQATNQFPESVKTIDEMEREHLEKILRRFNYNISTTARALDISRKTMHNKLKKYNIVIKRTAALEGGTDSPGEEAEHQPGH